MTIIRKTVVPGPCSRELAVRLRRCESANVTYISDDFPIFWESAAGCYVVDVDGNSFLDMTAAFGVSALGHCHPAITSAVRDQAGLLLHGMGDVHPSKVKVELCERIARNSPIPDARVILGQNGSDAVEAAVKTARLATRRRGVLAFTGAYHGLSYGALNVTAREDFRTPFLDQLGDFVTHLPYACNAESVDIALATGAIGAVILEPIQGRGGIIVPPEGWIAEIAECCRRHGALLIVDEIFTGWGRTGAWFACTQENVVPDIHCLGKAMGGGLPISACVASAALMSAWGESRGEALLTSTFLGNPVACAAAIASIDAMVALDIPARARVAGNSLQRRLRELGERYPAIISEVRGRGLMLGVQISSQPLADRLVRGALASGLIVLPAGDGSVIEFVPPLTISEAEMEEAVAVFAAAMAGLALK